MDIKCGDVEPNPGVNFTYYVQTSDRVQILQSNSPSYLKVNLTSSYNERIIYCRYSTAANQDGQVCYRLNITCEFTELSMHDVSANCIPFIVPPQVDANYIKPFGSHKRPYVLRCPQFSNPPPKCSWKFFFPCPFPFRISVDPGPGVVYSSDGCEATINVLTANYSGVCFECMAMNKLGNSTTLIDSINFDSKIIIMIVCCWSLNSRSVCFSPYPACQGEGTQIITTDGQAVPSDSGVLTRYVGDTLSLTCTGTAVPSRPNVYWKANLVETNQTQLYSCLDEEVARVTCSVLPYSRVDCNAISILNFTHLTLNDTGNYTCFIDYGGSFAHTPVSVRLQVLGEVSFSLSLSLTSSVFC